MAEQDQAPREGAIETTGDMVASSRPDIVPLVRDGESDVMLVDLGLRTVHTVNVTGGMVWARCDGERTVDGITSALAEAFATQPDLIRDDVERSVTEFRLRGLLRTDEDPPFPTLATVSLDPGPDGTRYVQPEPCSCGVDLDALEWAGTVAAQVSTVRMGIRFNSDDAGDRIREVLDQCLIEDPGAPIAYTVVLLDDGDAGGTTGLRNGFYEGRRFQMGSPDHDGILAALEKRVAAWLPAGPDEVRLGAFGMQGPAGTVLIPAFGALDKQLSEACEREGFTFIDSPATIDIRSMTVAGHSLQGVIWPGPETERLDDRDSLGRLVMLAVLHPDDDTEARVDSLDLLAGKVDCLLTPADQITDVAAAIIRGT